LGDRKNAQEVLIYVDSQALCGAPCERLLHRLTYQIFIILRHIFLGTAEFYAVMWNGKRGDGLAANIPWFFILSLYQMAQVLPLVVSPGPGSVNYPFPPRHAHLKLLKNSPQNLLTNAPKYGLLVLVIRVSNSSKLSNLFGGGKKSDTPTT
jgi:hypothetical protein